jgi:RNA polymerase sigma factor (sigma-70 family)
MEWSDAAISQRVEIAMGKIKTEIDGRLAVALLPILQINRDRGRIRKFLDRGTVATVDEYVARVADCYEKLHPYLHDLQVKRDEAEWSRLLIVMTRRAYNFLCRKGLPASEATRDRAETCAQEAARRVLTAHFPYDTEFQPWLFVILHFMCARELKDAFQPEPTDIADAGEHLVDPGAETGRQVETRLHLLREMIDAVEKLAPARKTIIVRYYFQGRSFEEIAHELDRSINAVYQLHFYALRDLRVHFDG